MPDVDVEVLDSSAAGDIDKLEVEVEINTTLAVGNILTNQLARDEVRADGDLWDQSAAGVGAENSVKRSVESVASAGNIVTDGAPLLQGGGVTLRLEGLWIGCQQSCFKIPHGNGIRLTLGKSTLLTKLLSGSSTSGNSTLLQGEGVGRAGAFGQRAAGLDLLGLVGGDLPLDLLSGVNLAGMSNCSTDDGGGGQRGCEVAEVDHFD